MASKALAPAVIDQTTFASSTPPTVAAVEAEMQRRQQEALVQYGNGGPYVREVYVSEIRRDMARTVEAIINIGRRLLVMKACEGHGGWLDCLQSLGMGEDGAQRMMLAARKVGSLPNTATSRYLLEAAGNGSKLFDLMTLPDEELHSLVEGGALANGTKLDDIKAMTVRELRQSLAEARDEIATKDARAATREKEIDRLQAGLRKVRREYDLMPPGEVEIELRNLASTTAGGIATRIATIGSPDEPNGSLHQRFNELLEHGRANGSDHTAFLAGLLVQLESAIGKLREDFGLPIVAIGTEPQWMADARAAGELN